MGVSGKGQARQRARSAAAGRVTGERRPRGRPVSVTTQPGDRLVLGVVDLKKERAMQERAYADVAGVAARSILELSSVRRRPFGAVADPGALAQARRAWR